MEKIVKNVQPPARKVSPYAFPGLIKPETIRKDAPKPEEKKTSLPSPYVMPGLRTNFQGNLSAFGNSIEFTNTKAKP